PAAALRADAADFAGEADVFVLVLIRCGEDLGDRDFIRRRELLRRAVGGDELGCGFLFFRRRRRRRLSRRRRQLLVHLLALLLRTGRLHLAVIVLTPQQQRPTNQPGANQPDDLRAHASLPLLG